MNKLQQDNRMVHKLVKKTAMELAGVFYEWQASQKRYGDDFYRLYPNVKAFQKRDWPNFVRAAKESLAGALASNNLTEADKDKIYKALLDDATLPYSQQEVQITNFGAH